MNTEQKKIAAAIKSRWPDATIKSNDAGCYYARVEAPAVNDVSALFRHPDYGVCVGEVRPGVVEIQF